MLQVKALERGLLRLRDGEGLAVFRNAATRLTNLCIVLQRADASEEQSPEMGIVANISEVAVDDASDALSAWVFTPRDAPANHGNGHTPESLPPIFQLCEYRHDAERPISNVLQLP